jgi:hypothetical protein
MKFGLAPQMLIIFIDIALYTLCNIIRQFYTTPESMQTEKADRRRFKKFRQANGVSKLLSQCCPVDFYRTQFPFYRLENGHTRETA